MNLSPVLIKIVSGTRFILLPFPLAVFLSLTLLALVDHITHPDRSKVVDDEPGEFIGGVLLLMLSGAVQVILGIPSLIALDRIKGHWAAYTITGSGLATLLSLILASTLRAPQFGETIHGMFIMIFLFFGAPLIISYLIAFAIKLLIDNPRS